MTQRLCSLPRDRLRTALLQCGLTPGTADAVLLHQPFADDTALCTAVDAAVIQLADAELKDALAAEPAPSVQSSNADVREATLLALQLYRDRFGYPYVSSINAPTADELLMRVRIRLGNEPEPESRAAREHLRRLVRSRIQPLLDAGPPA